MPAVPMTLSVFCPHRRHQRRIRRQLGLLFLEVEKAPRISPRGLRELSEFSRRLLISKLPAAQKMSLLRANHFSKKDLLALKLVADPHR